MWIAGWGTSGTSGMARRFPNQGNYDSSPALFFAWSAITLVVALGVSALVLFLLAPRLAGGPSVRSRLCSGARCW